MNNRPLIGVCLLIALMVIDSVGLVYSDGHDPSPDANSKNELDECADHISESFENFALPAELEETIDSMYPNIDDWAQADWTELSKSTACFEFIESLNNIMTGQSIDLCTNILIEANYDYRQLLEVKLRIAMVVCGTSFEELAESSTDKLVHQ